MTEPSIMPAAEAALRKIAALADTDPVAYIRTVRRLAHEADAAQVLFGNEFAVATYAAQRSVCSCGESFSQPVELRRHQERHEDHTTVRKGITYEALTYLVGVNGARIQQLISKGRQVAEDRMLAALEA